MIWNVCSTVFLFHFISIERERKKRNVIVCVLASGKFRREFRRAFAQCCHSSNHRTNYQPNNMSPNNGLSARDFNKATTYGRPNNIYASEQKQNVRTWQRLILTSADSKRRVTWASNNSKQEPQISTAQETQFISKNFT